MRLVITGIVMLVAAAGFFFYMMGMAPRSNDPQALMQTVGQVSGVVGGIGIVMLLVGLFKKN
jgi:hypothetical protein